jgi:hypothetical protein
MRQSSGFALALAMLGALPGMVADAVAQPAAKETAAKATHLFAVGVCPPWKTAPGDADLTAKWAASCRNDVQLITDGLSKALTIGTANVTALIDKEATHGAVVAGLEQLAHKARPEDRVIIYLNTHGGEVDASYKGYGMKDEVFAFYSDKEPTDIRQAVAQGPWMSARALRDRIDTIASEEIIVILETCHSGASYGDFRYDLGGRYRSGWKGREAIIFSAAGDQVANFAEGNDRALFTKTFAEILEARGEKTLGDAFQKARLETHRDIRKRCMTGPYAQTMQLNHAAYLTYCTQQPDMFDPYGLLDDVALQRRADSAMR